MCPSLSIAAADLRPAHTCCWGPLPSSLDDITRDSFAPHGQSVGANERRVFQIVRDPSKVIELLRRRHNKHRRLHRGIVANLCDEKRSLQDSETLVHGGVKASVYFWRLLR
jgi:hypothetical protein